MVVAAFKELVLHSITVIMLKNESVVVLTKNLKSAMSENRQTETRLSQNALDSETRQKPSK